jgi:hypothetical protein
LPVAELDAVCGGRGEELLAGLGVANALSSFASYGSTNPAEVAKQLASWRKKLFSSED